MRIIKRSPLIFNQILYVIMSLLFLHVAYSLDAEKSAFDVMSLKALVEIFPIIFIVGIGCIVALYNVWKVSIILLSTLTLMVFYKTFGLFLIEFDKKLLLIMNVIYMIFSYNMILLLKEELKMSFYNKGHEDSCIDVENYKNLSVEVGKGSSFFNGVITNIDEYGIVVKFKEKVNLKGVVEVKIDQWETLFETEGVVVSKNEDALGIKMRKNSPGEFGWNEFYNIFYKRGYIC